MRLAAAQRKAGDERRVGAGSWRGKANAAWAGDGRDSHGGTANARPCEKTTFSASPALALLRAADGAGVGHVTDGLPRDDHDEGPHEERNL